MKIAMLSTFPPLPCGVGEFAERLMTAYFSLGHSVLKVAEVGRSGTEAPCDASFRFERQMYNASDLARSTLSLQPAIIDIQHEFGIWPDDDKFISMVDLFTNAGVPVVTTFHTVKRLGHQQLRRSLTGYRVVQSTKMLAALPNSVLLPHPTPNLSPRQEIVPTDYIKIVTPGFIARSKALENTMQALARVRAPFKWTIAGSADSFYLSDLNDIARRFGLGSQVKIISRYLTHAERTELINSADVVVLNSAGSKDQLDIPLSASGVARDVIALSKPSISPWLPIYDDLSPDISGKFAPWDDVALAELIESRFWMEESWQRRAVGTFEQLQTWTYELGAACRGSLATTGKIS